ncbi:MAG: hypothetical protein Q9163_005472 [Psora crenata]
MPAYAILGATGKTGGALLTLLLQSPANQINLYVRSKPKLLTQRPDLRDHKSVRIFEGPITDVALMQSCLAPPLDAVFITLGTNENTPGTRVNQDAAHVVVAACCQMKWADPSARPPKIILLSSASLNDRMTAHDPAILHWILLRAFSNPYSDLALAQRYLELHKSWLDVTYIQPGGLVEDEQKGHTLSLDRHAPSFMSYLDLAAAMIEVAQQDGYQWIGVSPLPKSNQVKVEWRAPPQMMRGLVWHFMPWVGHLMSYIGLF